MALYEQPLAIPEAGAGDDAAALSGAAGKP